MAKTGKGTSGPGGSSHGGIVGQAELRAAAFEREVELEPWKADHDEAMKVLSFETTLDCGIRIYDLFIAVDEKLRGAALRGEDVGDVPAVSRSLFEWWLRPCKRVARSLQEFERKGYEVKGAEAFRTRYAEGVWMLAPADKSFAHERIVEARDRAIDDLRGGSVETM